MTISVEQGGYNFSKLGGLAKLGRSLFQSRDGYNSVAYYDCVFISFVIYNFEKEYGAKKLNEAYVFSKIENVHTNSMEVWRAECLKI